jgi:hypothetical protein
VKVRRSALDPLLLRMPRRAIYQWAFPFGVSRSTAQCDAAVPAALR